MERKAVAAYVKDHPFLFVIEDSRVAEIHPIGSKKDTCVVGEIYIGKVKKFFRTFRQHLSKYVQEWSVTVLSLMRNKVFYLQSRQKVSMCGR